MLIYGASDPMKAKLLVEAGAMQPAAAVETMGEPGSYFESGFPHGGDQWISSMGTAWAVAGLAASMQ